MLVLCASRSGKVCTRMGTEHHVHVVSRRGAPFPRFRREYPPNWKPSPPIKDIYIRGGSKVQKQLMHRRRGGGLNSWQSAAGGARTRVASTRAPNLDHRAMGQKSCAKTEWQSSAGHGDRRPICTPAFYAAVRRPWITRTRSLRSSHRVHTPTTHPGALGPAAPNGQTNHTHPAYG